MEWLCGLFSYGLFSYWPCCQWSMICAALKITANSELEHLTLVCSRQLETQEKWATTGKIRFELSSNSELYVGNSGLFLELQLEDNWHHYSTLFFFPSSQLSWKHHESKECQSLMTKFAHKKDRHATFLFKLAQHNKVSPKMSGMLLHKLFNMPGK